MKTLFVLSILIVASAFVSASFNYNDYNFRLVKDEAYVPSPINPSLHADYIRENYVKIINADQSISFVKVIN